MYEVNYNGRTSNVNYYFCCRIRSEVLLCDAEGDLLAIAKFLYRRLIRPSLIRSPRKGVLLRPRV